MAQKSRSSKTAGKTPGTLGRPRSEDRRDAILNATFVILKEGGFSRLTVEGVARLAGSGKATIYRWWGNIGPLAVEAFMKAMDGSLRAPRQTESPIADLRAQIHGAAQMYRGRKGQLFKELVALGRADPKTQELLQRSFHRPRRAAALAAVKRAQDEGELRPQIDSEVLADALWAPIFHRALVTHVEFDRRFIDKHLDLVLYGARAGAIERRST